jgi:hypothetical protein
VGWLKDCRTITARFEKQALNDLAMVPRAMIQSDLRILDASDSA